MTPAGWGARVVRGAARRPARTLALCALLSVLGGLLALRLEPSAATDTLVGSGTDSYQATERLNERFGGDPIAVLVRGDLPSLVLTENLGLLVGLEGCLSGNKPPEIEAPGGPDSPCARLAETKPAQVVFGPGTFINSAVTEIGTQLQSQLQDAQTRAEAARKAAERDARDAGATDEQIAQAGEIAARDVQNSTLLQLAQLAARYGIPADAATNLTISNQQLVSTLVFDPAQGSYTPKARFAYLFPNDSSALISVRLKPGLSDAERTEAIRLVKAAVAMPEWKLANGGSYLVSGAPVVVDGITDSLSDSLIGLLLGGLLAMAIILPLVFGRARFRMLPLPIALGAAGIVFGLMSLLGARLTLASIAVLPVLLGLAVDYAIQYQARVQEDGVRHALEQAVPTIAIAVLATVAGFAVLLLSPVPMVRGFGLVLMAGVVVAFALALTAGTAALALLVRRPRRKGLAALRGADDLVVRQRAGACRARAAWSWASPCGGPCSCWASASRSRSAAGPSTRAPRSSPRSRSSSRATCPPSATCSPCRRTRASPARCRCSSRPTTSPSRRSSRG